MSDVLQGLSGAKSLLSDANYTGKISAWGFSVELDRKKAPGEIRKDDVASLNEIVIKLINSSRARNNEETVVVIDEFDRLVSDDERTRFADFIKQVGDQRVPVRFVFCGVAESLQTLLGTHASCYRYLEGIELKALSWDARFAIIDAATAALGVTFGDRPRMRIAAISDGFPHYIHRLCEHLLWQMFDDPLPMKTPTIDHYRDAVSQAVRGIEQHLRHAYERATMKNVPGYEETLWAMADHADFVRHIDSVRESYMSLFQDRGLDDASPLTRTVMLNRLSSLKGITCGNILGSSRKGWYFFRENIIRGYVRLRAEERGYELALDYSAATGSRRGLEWGPRNTRRTSASSPPRDWEPEL